MTETRVILILLLIVAVALPLAAQSDPMAGGPEFDGDNRLLRPTDYREWIFLSSSLGLSYAAQPNTGGTDEEVYHNVYINPSAHRHFTRTGQFPDGTILVLELMSAKKKNEPGLQGSYQGEQVGLEASVKDSRRFETAWTYYSFDEAGGGLKKSAEAFPKESCWSCHHTHAQTDHVFTQFYPTLKKKSK